MTQQKPIKKEKNPARNFFVFTQPNATVLQLLQHHHCNSGQLNGNRAMSKTQVTTNKTMQLKFPKKCERDKSFLTDIGARWSTPVFFGCDDASLYYGKVKGKVEQVQIFLGWYNS